MRGRLSCGERFLPRLFSPSNFFAKLALAPLQQLLRHLPGTGANLVQEE